MRQGSLFWLVLLMLAGCPGGSGALGDSCAETGDCGSSLQCVHAVCVERCSRAPDCGDGYACNTDGLCILATGELGDSCTSESDCGPGLACTIQDASPGAPMTSSCALEASGHPAAATCSVDHDCRNGTCALGHCVDLCRDTRDCGAGTSCVQIPRVESAGAMFGGCLQAHGALRWPIAIHAPRETVLLPIPDVARSVAVTFAVEDPAQKVGATLVIPPSHGNAVVDINNIDYYLAPVRHRPDYAQSTLVMPSSPTTPLEPGAYALTVSSLRLTTQGDVTGTATPTATAVIKLDTSVLLDLHFYFLNFDDHPCSAAFGGGLDASIAASASFFQNDFLGSLRTVFAHGGVALGTLTYEDLRNHPELDGLDVTGASSLLALAHHDVGVNVFFVRTLSPAGLQAFGPNPGPAGLPATRGSGIVIGLDTLCYRSWGTVARLTAHELARYMGLYDNIEVDADLVANHRDPIDDSDASSANLMFYSELGGGDLSPGQRDILGRSGVLR